MSKKSFDSSNELDFDALTHHSNARLKVPVTILKGKKPHPLRHVTLAELIQAIRTNEVKQLNESQTLVCAYEQYRKNVELGLPAPRKDYDEKKEALLGFMLGKFSYRVDEKEKCLEYIPCLVFDLDGCPSTYQLFLYQNRLKELVYVFAAFASPSGYGLRMLIFSNIS